MDLQPDACNSPDIVAVRHRVDARALLSSSAPPAAPSHAYNGRMRYLGVDPGGQRMGLAVGDDATGVASPLEIVPYEGADHATRLIAAVVEKVGAARVVLGLPTLENGTRGPACRRTDKLAAALSATGIEVALQSEFLTTDEARRRARATGRSMSWPVDDIAAQILLEEYLATQTQTPAVET